MVSDKPFHTLSPHDQMLTRIRQHQEIDKRVAANRKVNSQDRVDRAFQEFAVTGRVLVHILPRLNDKRAIEGLELLTAKAEEVVKSLKARQR